MFLKTRKICLSLFAALAMFSAVLYAQQAEQTGLSKMEIATVLIQSLGLEESLSTNLGEDSTAEVFADMVSILEAQGVQSFLPGEQNEPMLSSEFQDVVQTLLDNNAIDGAGLAALGNSDVVSVEVLQSGLSFLQDAGLSLSVPLAYQSPGAVGGLDVDFNLLGGDILLNVPDVAGTGLGDAPVIIDGGVDVDVDGATQDVVGDLVNDDPFAVALDAGTAFFEAGDFQSAIDSLTDALDAGAPNDEFEIEVLRLRSLSFGEVDDFASAFNDILAADELGFVPAEEDFAGFADITSNLSQIEQADGATLLDTLFNALEADVLDGVDFVIAAIDAGFRDENAIGSLQALEGGEAAGFNGDDVNRIFSTLSALRDLENNGTILVPDVDAEELVQFLFPGATFLQVAIVGGFDDAVALGELAALDTFLEFDLTLIFDTFEDIGQEAVGANFLVAAAQNGFDGATGLGNSAGGLSNDQFNLIVAELDDAGDADFAIAAAADGFADGVILAGFVANMSNQEIAGVANNLLDDNQADEFLTVAGADIIVNVSGLGFTDATVLGALAANDTINDTQAAQVANNLLAADAANAQLFLSNSGADVIVAVSGLGFNDPQVLGELAANDVINDAQAAQVANNLLPELGNAVNFLIVAGSDVIVAVSGLGFTDAFVLGVLASGNIINDTQAAQVANNLLAADAANAQLFLTNAGSDVIVAVSGLGFTDATVLGALAANDTINDTQAAQVANNLLADNAANAQLFLSNSGADVIVAVSGLGFTDATVLGALAANDTINDAQAAQVANNLLADNAANAQLFLSNSGADVIVAVSGLGFTDATVLGALAANDTINDTQAAQVANNLLADNAANAQLFLSNSGADVIVAVSGLGFTDATVLGALAANDTINDAQAAQVANNLLADNAANAQLFLSNSGADVIVAVSGLGFTDATVLGALAANDTINDAQAAQVANNLLADNAANAQLFLSNSGADVIVAVSGLGFTDATVLGALAANDTINDAQAAQVANNLLADNAANAQLFLSNSGADVIVAVSGLGFTDATVLGALAANDTINDAQAAQVANNLLADNAANAQLFLSNSGADVIVAVSGLGFTDATVLGALAANDTINDTQAAQVANNLLADNAANAQLFLSNSGADVIVAVSGLGFTDATVLGALAANDTINDAQAAQVANNLLADNAANAQLFLSNSGADVIVAVSGLGFTDATVLGALAANDTINDTQAAQVANNLLADNAANAQLFLSNSGADVIVAVSGLGFTDATVLGALAANDTINDAQAAQVANNLLADNAANAQLFLSNSGADVIVAVSGLGFTDATVLGALAANDTINDAQAAQVANNLLADNAANAQLFLSNSGADVIVAVSGLGFTDATVLGALAANDTINDAQAAQVANNLLADNAANAQLFLSNSGADVIVAVSGLGFTDATVLGALAANDTINDTQAAQVANNLLADNAANAQLFLSNSGADVIVAVSGLGFTDATVLGALAANDTINDAQAAQVANNLLADNAANAQLFLSNSGADVIVAVSGLGFTDATVLGALAANDTINDTQAAQVANNLLADNAANAQLFLSNSGADVIVAVSGLGFTDATVLGALAANDTINDAQAAQVANNLLADNAANAQLFLSNSGADVIVAVSGLGFTDATVLGALAANDTINDAQAAQVANNLLADNAANAQLFLSNSGADVIVAVSGLGFTDATVLGALAANDTINDAQAAQVANNLLADNAANAQLFLSNSGADVIVAVSGLGFTDATVLGALAANDTINDAQAAQVANNLLADNAANAQLFLSNSGADVIVAVSGLGFTDATVLGALAANDTINDTQAAQVANNLLADNAANAQLFLSNSGADVIVAVSGLGFTDATVLGALAANDTINDTQAAQVANNLLADNAANAQLFLSNSGADVIVAVSGLGFTDATVLGALAANDTINDTQAAQVANNLLADNAANAQLFLSNSGADVIVAVSGLGFTDATVLGALAANDTINDTQAAQVANNLLADNAANAQLFLSNSGADVIVAVSGLGFTDATVLGALAANDTINDTQAAQVANNLLADNAANAQLFLSNSGADVIVAVSGLGFTDATVLGALAANDTINDTQAAQVANNLLADNAANAQLFLSNSGADVIVAVSGLGFTDATVLGALAANDTINDTQAAQVANNLLADNAANAQLFLSNSGADVIVAVSGLGFTDATVLGALAANDTINDTQAAQVANNLLADNAANAQLFLSNSGADVIVAVSGLGFTDATVLGALAANDTINDTQAAQVANNLLADNAANAQLFLSNSGADVIVAVSGLGFTDATVLGALAANDTINDTQAAQVANNLLADNAANAQLFLSNSGADVIVAVSGLGFTDATVLGALAANDTINDTQAAQVANNLLADNAANAQLFLSNSGADVIVAVSGLGFTDATVLGALAANDTINDTQAAQVANNLLADNAANAQLFLSNSGADVIVAVSGLGFTDATVLGALAANDTINDTQAAQVANNLLADNAANAQLFLSNSGADVIVAVSGLGFTDATVLGALAANDTINDTQAAQVANNLLADNAANAQLFLSNSGADVIVAVSGLGFTDATVLGALAANDTINDTQAAQVANNLLADNADNAQLFLSNSGADVIVAVSGLGFTDATVLGALAANDTINDTQAAQVANNLLADNAANAQLFLSNSGADVIVAVSGLGFTDATVLGALAANDTINDTQAAQVANNLLADNADNAQLFLSNSGADVIVAVSGLGFTDATVLGALAANDTINDTQAAQVANNLLADNAANAQLFLSNSGADVIVAVSGLGFTDATVLGALAANDTINDTQAAQVANNLLADNADNAQLFLSNSGADVIVAVSGLGFTDATVLGALAANDTINDTQAAQVANNLLADNADNAQLFLSNSGADVIVAVSGLGFTDATVLGALAANDTINDTQAAQVANNLLADNAANAQLFLSNSGADVIVAVSGLGFTDATVLGALAANDTINDTQAAQVANNLLADNAANAQLFLSNSGADVIVAVSGLGFTDAGVLAALAANDILNAAEAEDVANNLAAVDVANAATFLRLAGASVITAVIGNGFDNEAVLVDLALSGDVSATQVNVTQALIIANNLAQAVDTQQEAVLFANQVIALHDGNPNDDIVDFLNGFRVQNIMQAFTNSNDPDSGASNAGGALRFLVVVVTAGEDFLGFSDGDLNRTVDRLQDAIAASEATIAEASVVYSDFYQPLVDDIANASRAITVSGVQSYIAGLANIGVDEAQATADFQAAFDANEDLVAEGLVVTDTSDVVNDDLGISSFASPEPVLTDEGNSKVLFKNNAGTVDAADRTVVDFDAADAEFFDNTGFDYFAWGKWTNNDGAAVLGGQVANGAEAFFVNGFKSTAGQVQDRINLGGTATFNGTLNGAVQGTGAVVDGTMQVVADFGAATASGTLNFTGGITATGAFDPAAISTTGVHYQGSLAGAGSSNVASGHVQGIFGGPQLTETAAVWQVTTDGGVSAAGAGLAQQ